MQHFAKGPVGQEKDLMQTGLTVQGIDYVAQAKETVTVTANVKKD